MTSSINVIMRWKKMFRCEARLRAVFLLLENPWKRTQNKLAYERKCKRDMRMTKLRAASSTSVGRRAKRETVTFLMLIDIHLERCIDLVSADSRPIYRPIVDRLLSVTSVKYLTMDVDHDRVSINYRLILGELPARYRWSNNGNRTKWSPIQSVIILVSD